MADTIIKTFRYRIYPTKRQDKLLSDQLAVCCELYNAAIQERSDAWKRERKSISYFDQTVQLTHIKPIREDVAAIHSTVLENVLKRVDLAFAAFYRRVRNGHKPGYPRFKPKNRYNSIRFRQWAAPPPKGGKIRLSKIGRVRVKQHRPLEGAIKALLIKREAGRWYALFACECAPQPLDYKPDAIGIDVGISNFATFSTGEKIDNPRYYETAQRKLRIAQRRVARRKRGSNRRRKAVALLQRAMVHVRYQRADFHHKLSRRLVNENGLIAVEDLNIAGLARMWLAKQIHDAAWGQFLNFSAYKAEWAGRVFVRVNPSGTSQTCTCGAAVRKTLSERWHLCLSCGMSADRDHVSAQVIKARGEPSGANVDVLVSCVA